jgi:hypothetical protein
MLEAEPSNSISKYQSLLILTNVPGLKNGRRFLLCKVKKLQ